MDRPELRVADLSDCDALLNIEAMCFSHSGDGFNRRQMRYLLSRAKAKTLLVMQDGDTAGYCSVLLPQHPRPARLYSVALAPKHRGRGCAGFLMNAVLAEASAKGYARIRLEVSEQNGAAQKLYARFGFERIRVIPGYYADGSGAIRMEKTL
ncbi:MAG: N-acetyltransferase [Gammaproteobacteria bacterium]